MKTPRRAPLTHRVRDGLRCLAAHCEAGGPADLSIGSNANDPDSLNATDRSTWEKVLAACEWINELAE